MVPSGFAPPSDTVTVEPAGAVPVRVTESLELTTPWADDRSGRGLSVGGVASPRHAERARFCARPRRSRVGGGECRMSRPPSAGVVKLQAPVLLAVVGPERWFASRIHTVTVEPARRVPVRVTESLEFSTP